MADSRHLENLILHQNYVANCPVWMKFGKQMQNDMPMVMQMWKWKLELEFHHGGQLLSENGSSNMAAMDWDISPKFGLQVDFNLPKWTKSQKTKPEVELPRYGRHLEKLMWCHNFNDGLAAIWIKFSNCRPLASWVRGRAQTKIKFSAFFPQNIASGESKLSDS